MPIKSGTLFYAKVFGDGGRNYENDGNEWSFDFIPTPEAFEEMQAEGVKAKPKNKGDERGDFYSFNKPTLKKDGTPAKPIEVVDRAGKPWPNNKALGNGTGVDIKYILKEYEYKGKKGIKRAILAIRVKDHVPYEAGEDFAYDDDWAADDE